MRGSRGHPAHGCGPPAGGLRGRKEQPGHAVLAGRTGKTSISRSATSRSDVPALPQPSTDSKPSWSAGKMMSPVANVCNKTGLNWYESCMRSIPEKTLEHWSSIYLSNRFPDGALWWPTSGEDVLVELPRLAATGPGKTLALELKTTEAEGVKHVLWIDTGQLQRYLSPPGGPPLPVYYVFPLPHWTGPLTSQHGSAPGTPNPMVGAPPEWWRQRAGLPWFGNWLYVMSAQAVASALPPGWRKGSRAKLFSLNAPHDPNLWPVWERVLDLTPVAEPVIWPSFWNDVSRWGPFGRSAIRRSPLVYQLPLQRACAT